MLRMLPVALALCLLLVGGAASAQGDDAPLTLELGAFDTPLAPQGMEGSIPVHVDVSCAHFDGVPPAVHVSLEIVAAPEWVRAELVPSAHDAELASCSDGRVAFESELKAAALDGAEAFADGIVRVVATATDAQGGVSAEDEAAVVADYAGIVLVLPVEVSRSATPGDQETFVVTLTSQANGDARVAFSLDADAVIVAGPPPEHVVVAPGATRDVSFRIEAPPGLVAETEREFWLEVVVASADDPSKGVETARFEFTLIPADVEPASADAPAPGLPLLAAAVAAVALGLRHRRG